MVTALDGAWMEKRKNSPTATSDQKTGPLTPAAKAKPQSDPPMALAAAQRASAVGRPAPSLSSSIPPNPVPATPVAMVITPNRRSALGAPYTVLATFGPQYANTPA